MGDQRGRVSQESPLILTNVNNEGVKSKYIWLLRAHILSHILKWANENPQPHLSGKSHAVHTLHPHTTTQLIHISWFWHYLKTINHFLSVWLSHEDSFFKHTLHNLSCGHTDREASIPQCGKVNMQLPKETREALAEIFTLFFSKGLCGRAALCKQFFPHQWVVGIGKQKWRNNKYLIKVPKNREWQVIKSQFGAHYSVF